MAWTQVYSVGREDLPATGYHIPDNEAEVLAPAVQDLLADTKGIEELRLSLESIARTDFQQARLEQILATEKTTEEWRVGEALAEHHLTGEGGCVFPWPSGRDLKNPGTSSGGVDLIGFDLTNGAAAFALAEVKTSQQLKYPPDLMTGRHGLQGQLEGLRDGDDRKTWAIKYIGLHAQSRDWFPYFQQAMIRYLNDPSDVRLFGTLVHLVGPDSRDLAARVQRLASGRPDNTQIRLFAFYLSSHGLATLAGTSVEWETAQ